MTIEQIIEGETVGAMVGKLNADIERGNRHLLPNQKRVVAFGNSITAAPSNFVSFMAFNAGGKYLYVKNAGVNGDTTTQMVARLSDIDGADAVTIMEAVNDQSNAITLDTHRTNIEAILDYCDNQNIMPMMIASAPADDFGRGRYAHEANIIDYITCRKRGVPMYHPWDDIIDDSGDANQVSSLTLDGIHPNTAGHRASGAKLLDDIKNDNYFIPMPIYNDLSRATSALNDNALFINGTSGNPDSWNTFGATSEALAVTSLGIGNTYTVKYINNAVNFNTDYFPANAGDTYLAVMKLKIDNISGEPDLLVRIDRQSASTVQDAFWRHKGGSTDEILVAYEFVAPENTTALRFSFYANAGTYEVDISIAQAQIYNLTYYGL